MSQKIVKVANAGVAVCVIAALIKLYSNKAGVHAKGLSAIRESVRQSGPWTIIYTPPHGWSKLSLDVIKSMSDFAKGYEASHLSKPKADDKRPRIVCLCGSGRFRDVFDKAEFDETLAGKIVLTIGCNTKDVARDVELERYKSMLDRLHLRKIDMADEVLILNVNGYIGDSTRRELQYAIDQGKDVRYLEPVDGDDSEAIG